MDEKPEYHKLAAESAKKSERIADLWYTADALASRQRKSGSQAFTCSAGFMKLVLEGWLNAMDSHDAAMSVLESIRTVAENDGLLAGESLTEWVQRRLVARN